MVAVAVLKLGTSNLRETERLGKDCTKIVTDEMKGMLLQINNEFTGKSIVHSPFGHRRDYISC